MDSLAKVDDQWVPLQVKVFSRWVSSQLQGHSDAHVDDITKDLTNGVALCDLATILTRKDAPRAWAHDPKRTVDMVQNCELAVDMFAKDGVKLIGISGKDINDNNMKLVLGLVWSLILHYSVGQSVSSNPPNGKENTDESRDAAGNVSVKNQKDALLSWAAERTANYPHIHNFQPFDLSLCALLDTYVPDKINYYSLDPSDSQHNSQLATNVMQDLGIPVFVYPDELERHDNKVDEKTLLTQLSTAKVVLDKRPDPMTENVNKAPADVPEENVDEFQEYDEDEVSSHPEESDDVVEKDVDLNDGSVVDGENPEWVIEEDEIPVADASNDSLIDLSVVPVGDPANTKNGVSILASSAEWVTNDGINNQVFGKTNASADNLIDLSVSDEQSDVANADSKLIGDSQDRDVPVDQPNNNDDEELQVHSRDVDIEREEDPEQHAAAMKEIEECMRRDQEENKNLPDKVVIDGLEFTNIRVRDIQIEPKPEAEAPAAAEEEESTKSDSDSGTENYDDAVLVWVNPEIDVGTATPDWVIDDPGEVEIVPDHLDWELDDDSVPEDDGRAPFWVIEDDAAPPADGDEEVMEWVVVDENGAEAVEEGPTEPEWVILAPGLTHRSLTAPSIQKWEITDAQADAIKMKSAEENLEQEVLARDISFHDVNEHGLPDNEESADYSARHMFVIKKSWF